jgi:hypothetical protein
MGASDCASSCLCVRVAVTRHGFAEDGRNRVTPSVKSKLTSAARRTPATVSSNHLPSGESAIAPRTLESLGTTRRGFDPSTGTSYSVCGPVHGFRLDSTFPGGTKSTRQIVVPSVRVAGYATCFPSGDTNMCSSFLP